MIAFKSALACAAFAAAGALVGRFGAPVAEPASGPPLVQTDGREMTRALWFAMNDGKFAGVAGQFTFQYGAPKWSDRLEGLLASSTLKRWRFGKDAWTTFDANVPVTLGGVEVPVGGYYAALERTKAADGGAAYALVLLDPKAVREKRLDPFQADETTGGIVVPLKHELVKDAAGDFKIAMTPTAGKERDLELAVTYGPHRLTAPVVARF